MKNLKPALQILGIYYLSALFSVIYAQDKVLQIRNYYSQHEVNFLYRDCINRLVFEFMQDGKLLKIKDLHYQIKNGELIVGTVPNEFKIIPKNAKPIEIIAKSGETIIASKTLTIRTIDIPKIYLSDSTKGKPLNLKSPIFLPKKLYLVVEVNQNTPKDIYYSIKSIDVFLFRQGREIDHFHTTLEELDMSRFKTQSGDGIQIIINSLERQTSIGEILPIPVKTLYIDFLVQ
jgi:hypothetical protein